VGEDNTTIDDQFVDDFKNKSNSDFYAYQAKLAEKLYNEAKSSGAPSFKQRVANVVSLSRAAAYASISDSGEFVTTSALATQTLAKDFLSGNFWSAQINGPVLESSMVPYYNPALRWLNTLGSSFSFNRYNSSKWPSGFLSDYYARERGVRSENWGDVARYMATPARKWGIGALDWVTQKLGFAEGTVSGLAGQIGLYQDPTGYARQLAYSGRRTWGLESDLNPEKVGKLSAEVARGVFKDMAGLDPEYRNFLLNMTMASGSVQYRKGMTGQEFMREITDVTKGLNDLRRSAMMSKEDFVKLVKESGPELISISTPSGIRQLSAAGTASDIRYGIQAKLFGFNALRQMTTEAGAERMSGAFLLPLYSPAYGGMWGRETVMQGEAQRLMTGMRDPRTQLIALGLGSGAKTVQEAMVAGAGVFMQPGGFVHAMEAGADVGAAQEFMATDLLTRRGFNMDTLFNEGNKQRYPAIELIANTMFNGEYTKAFNLFEQLKLERQSSKNIISSVYNALHGQPVKGMFGNIGKGVAALKTRLSSAQMVEVEKITERYADLLYREDMSPADRAVGEAVYKLRDPEFGGDSPENIENIVKSLQAKGSGTDSFKEIATMFKETVIEFAGEVDKLVAVQ